MLFPKFDKYAKKNKLIIKLNNNMCLLFDNNTISFRKILLILLIYLTILTVPILQNYVLTFV